MLLVDGISPSAWKLGTAIVLSLLERRSVLSLPALASTKMVVWLSVLLVLFDMAGSVMSVLFSASSVALVVTFEFSRFCFPGSPTDK